MKKQYLAALLFHNSLNSETTMITKSYTLNCSVLTNRVSVQNDTIWIWSR